MKRFVFWQILIAALLMAPDSQAQSLKDLLNKENIEKAVNAITGKSTASMEGTWTYAGSAIEFESDNLLQKAGGAVAANAAENKLNEQFARVGRTNVFHFQCRQHLHSQSWRKKHKRNLLLRCFHTECKSEIHEADSA